MALNPQIPQNSDCYAKRLAMAIFKGQYNLRKVEIDLKLNNYGFITYNKVVRELKKLQNK